MKVDKEELIKLRMVDLAKLINTKLTVIGDKQRALCPFHAEKTPSFYIYADNSFHCFACGAHGKGAIDYVMQIEKCTFLQACNELKRL